MGHIDSLKVNFSLLLRVSRKAKGLEGGRMVKKVVPKAATPSATIKSMCYLVTPRS
ncbi:hypothetical protein BDN67DRAFT_967971 [Paxillus ammoniavirescens]|nr:hypothetical protein BDN67DRAFT_967971 [Paxillus ammoniavirescens]